MITRNRLFGLLVLVAGLTAGYFASRAVNNSLDLMQTDLPQYYSKEEIPVAAIINLTTLYKQNEKQLSEVLSQGQNQIREAARRRQVLLQSRDRVREHHEAYEELIIQAEREVDLRRLLDYYSQFYMHYLRWLDTGNPQNAVQYKLALGQSKATLDYILETQQETPVLSAQEAEELLTLVRIVEQSNRTIRWARVVVVILLFLLLMGIPRLIRDSGFKKFAGSLYFDALFRTNHVSDLNRWHNLQRMAILLPGVYIFGLVICSSFISWRIPLIFGVLGFIPVIILVCLSGIRAKLFPLLLSYMAPKMLVLIMVLGVVAIRGPNFFWFRIWDGDLFRGIFISLVFMVIFHKIFVSVILARKWSHRNRSGSAAMVGLAIGLQFLIAGALMYGFGLAECLTTLNSELMLVPAYMVKASQSFLNTLMIIAGVLTVSSFSVFVFNIRSSQGPSDRVNS